MGNPCGELPIGRAKTFPDYGLSRFLLILLPSLSPLTPVTSALHHGPKTFPARLRLPPLLSFTGITPLVCPILSGHLLEGPELMRSDHQLS